MRNMVESSVQSRLSLRVSAAVARGLRESSAIALAGLALVVCMALLSFDPHDRGFSFTGNGGPVHNRIARGPPAQRQRHCPNRSAVLKPPHRAGRPSANRAKKPRFYVATNRHALDASAARTSGTPPTGYALDEPRTIRRLLKKNFLKPWRRVMWCVGVLTEEYRRRMYELLDLYARPWRPDEPVVCVDEKSTQLLQHSRTPLPMRAGAPQRVDYEYVRAGTRNLFVAVEPKGCCRPSASDSATAWI